MSKKTLNIEESEVADALRMLRKGDKVSPPASVPSKPVKVKQTGPSSIVDLKDGTSMDLTAFIQASIESFMAQKWLLNSRRVRESHQGRIRVLDPSTTHKGNSSSKRSRPCFEQTEDDSGQSDEEFAQDEDESTDESYSDEDEDEREVPFTLSSVFGPGFNADPDPNTVKEDSRGVARSGA